LGHFYQRRFVAAAEFTHIPLIWHCILYVIAVTLQSKLFHNPNSFTMKVAATVAGGLAGTLAVASIHEALRRVTPNAPRMDILDMELIRKGLKSINKKVPAADKLQRWAVGGELLCDTAYYSLAGMGGKKGVWLRGTLLGLVAGVSAVVLPKPLGLPSAPSSKTLGTQLMTIGLYLMGGLVAAAITQLVDDAQSRNEKKEEGSDSAKAYKDPLWY
jgi:hypothetical protein